MNKMIKDIDDADRKDQEFEFQKLVKDLYDPANGKLTSRGLKVVEYLFDQKTCQESEKYIFRR